MRPSLGASRALPAAALCLLAACGAPLPSEDASPDARADGAGEVTTPGPDAESPDASPDSAPSLDASTADDTAPDAPPDAPALDAPRPDASPETGVDAAPDGPPAEPPPLGNACSIRGVSGACMATASCASGQVTMAGLCPGPSTVQCCAPPDATWCPSHGFALPNEALTEEPGVGGCPSGMLRIDTFCVDRFEASLRLVHADGSTSGWSPYWHPVPGLRYRAVSLRGGVPQGYVSGTQAAAACAEAGKRLCSDTEWLRACQGPTRTTYPYGNTRRDGVCNDARATHPAIECFGTSASWIWSDIGYPGINQQADTVSLAGSHTGCVTAEGAYDMMGNLHEWTADPAGTFRGGYYVDTRINGNGCLYATTAHDTSHWDYSTGFRCCATP